MRIALVPALVGLGLAPAIVHAETRRVTAGSEYAAGAFHRLWFGQGYRDLWTTPIEAPVLDLDREGGGLTPVRQVGQLQTPGLALRGGDGRAYTFRSLQKEPERVLPPEWRDLWPAKIVRDQTAATHPAAALVMAALAEAAGVPHTQPRLVIMPDDPRLGAFAKTFGNQLGTIEEYPLPAGEGRPGFAGASEIVNSQDLWKRWLDGPANRVDARAFLRARVLDVWTDNYDRHAGQWRFMRVPGAERWQPLPEDPDMVLLHRDGLALKAARNQVPNLLHFGKRYPGKLEGVLMNAYEMDRWLLSDLDRAAFEEVARDLQSRLTDDVIDRALRAMPPEWFALSGARTGAALRSRRDRLPAYLDRIYRYYARSVDVHATDRAEQVKVTRAADGTVTLAIEESGAASFQRTFRPDETNEIRLYLHGGDDRVEVTGGRGAIRLRVMAGGGRDVVNDAQGGGTDVWRDAGEVDVARGPGTRVHPQAWKNPDPRTRTPWREPRNHGSYSQPGATLNYATDVGVVMGYAVTRDSWGFRAGPPATTQTIRGSFVTSQTRAKLEYVGTFRRPASHQAFGLQVYASELERYNFFGFGNESAPESDRSRYASRQAVVFLSPTWRLERGGRFVAAIGPELRYSDSRRADDDNILGQVSPYGVGGFGQVALQGSLRFDSRESASSGNLLTLAETFQAARANERTGGVRLLASGFVTPSAWDVESTYGGVDASAAAYFGIPRAHVGVRVGGSRAFGRYPWFDAAALGGATNRGFASQRFTGDSALYASASVGSWLGTLRTSVFPARVGLVAFTDTGRVWLEGEESDEWHTSVGGGLLLQPLGTRMTLHVLVAHGREGTRTYYGLGYPF